MRNLIFTGRDLLHPQKTGDPPTEEHIRRAVSNAYYGLFHALATSNAEVLIGTPHDTITASAWTRVYHAPNHGTVRTEPRRHRQEFSAAGQNFAAVFGGLQGLRHYADYDPP